MRRFLSIRERIWTCLVVEDDPLITTDIIVTLEACSARFPELMRSLTEPDRPQAFAVTPCDVVVVDHKLAEVASDKLTRSRV